MKKTNTAVFCGPLALCLTLKLMLISGKGGNEGEDINLKPPRQSFQFQSTERLRQGHIFRKFQIANHARILRSNLNFLPLKIVFSHFPFPTFFSPFKSWGRTFKDENSDLVPISHFSGPNSISFHIQLPNSWFPISHFLFLTSHFLFLTSHFSFLTWFKKLKYEKLNYSRVLYFQFGY